MENKKDNNGDDWLQFIFKYLTSVEVLTSAGPFIISLCVLLTGVILSPIIIGNMSPRIYFGILITIFSATLMSIGVFAIIRREINISPESSIKGKRAILLGILIIVLVLLYEAYMFEKYILIQ